METINRTVPVPTFEDPFGKKQETASTTKSGGGSNASAYYETERVGYTLPILKAITDALTTLTTPAGLKQERDDIETRLSEARVRQTVGDMLSFAGNQAGAAMSQGATEQISTLQYLVSLIDSNPEAYKRHKAFSVLKDIGQGLTGVYGILSQTALEKAPALSALAQAMQGNAMLMQVSRGGSGTEGSDAMDDKTVLAIAQEFVRSGQPEQAQKLLKSMYGDLLPADSKSTKSNK